MTWIRYRLKLATLNRKRQRLRESYRKEIEKAASKPNAQDLVGAIHAESSFEDQILDEEISARVTDRLMDKARRMFLPVPDYSDESSWIRCEVTSRRYVLTNNGITTLRASLRTERKSRIELTAMVLAALTGIIGAITGLVAVWRH